MVYRFRDGQTYSGIDANIAGQELEHIREANGGKLYTAAVVEAAKRKSSPIHDAFTWDDGKAAHEFRLTEARYFLRNIVVVQDAETEPSPAFVHVNITTTEGAEAYYQSTAVLTDLPSEYEGALSSCVSRLESAQRSLSELQRLAERGKKAKAKRAAAHVRAAIKEVA
jgi:hypothetical protein